MNVWDVRLNAGKSVKFSVTEGHTTSFLVLKGRVKLPGGEEVGEAAMAVLEREGDTFAIEALKDTTLLVLTGAPIDEPVVGYGPFVMNTQAEIREAIADFNSGKMGRIPAAAV